jgi:hypothetical protein
MNSDRPSAAVEVLMQEYSLSQRADDDADASRQVVQAGLEVLRWYQARLLELEPGPVEELRAWELTRKRDWALHVLIRYKGGDKGWAKRQQLEITADRPLAICTGGHARRRAPRAHDRRLSAEIRRAVAAHLERAKTTEAG